MRIPSVRIALMLFAASFSSSVHAQITTNTQRFDFSVDGTAIAGCNGEIIDLHGTIHSIVNLTQTSSGFISALTISSYRDVTGTGETTGAKYHMFWLDGIHSLTLPNGQTTFTTFDTLRMISNGAAPNSVANEMTVVSMRPDGSIGLSIQHSRATCE